MKVTGLHGHCDIGMNQFSRVLGLSGHREDQVGTV